MCFVLSAGVYYPRYDYLDIAGGEARSCYLINVSSGEVWDFEFTCYTPTAANVSPECFRHASLGIASGLFTDDAVLLWSRPVYGIPFPLNVVATRLQ